MTQRKPRTVSFPDWVEAQISAAQRSGAFDNLAGKGKPIPGLGGPRSELDWVAGWLRREQVQIASLLPPQLALAKEVEDLRGTVTGLHSEARVRAAVTDLNDRIRAAHRLPQDGPPLRVYPLDADAVVEQWRADRAELAALRAATPPQDPTAGSVPATAAPRSWRRWWRRRRRG